MNEFPPRLANPEPIEMPFVKNPNKKDTILPKCYTIFPLYEKGKE